MNNSSRNANSEDSANALIDIAQKDVAGVLKLFDTTLEGLTETEAQQRLAKSGLNEIAREQPKKWYVQLLKTVTNPLSLLLIVLAIVSPLTGSPTAALIITIVVIFGGLLRFFQEFQSNKAAEKHVDLIDNQEKNPLELINLCFMGTSSVLKTSRSREGIA